MLKTIKQRIFLIETLLVFLLPVTAAYSKTVGGELQQIHRMRCSICKKQRRSMPIQIMQSVLSMLRRG